MKTLPVISILLFIFLAVTSLFSANSFAGGYQISLTSAEGLGRAYAGEIADDSPLTTIRNPAAIMLTEGSAFSNALIALWLRYDFETTHNPYSEVFSADKILADLPGFLFSGGDPEMNYRYDPVMPSGVDDAGTKIAFPTLAYVNNQGDWGFGLSQGIMFAYEFDPKEIPSVGETFGDLYFKIAHFTGNLAYQVNDEWSVGLGLSVIPGFAKIERNAAELAYIIEDLENTNLIGGVAGAVVDLLGASKLKDPNANIAKFKGRDVTWGWNVGITWQPSSRDRFSFVYHAASELTMKGDYESDLPTSLNTLGAITGNPMLFPEATDGRKVDAELELGLPEWMEYAGWHQFRDDWELFYSVRWTNWTSSFDGIVFESTDGSGVQAGIDLEITDNIKFAVGLDHQYNEDWKIRAGFAVDEAYHPNDKNMLLNSPDSRRWWLSTGASYQYDDTTSLDFGLSYIYFEGDKVVERNLVLGLVEDKLMTPGLSGLLGINNINVEADIDLSVWLAGIQFNKKF